MKRWAHICLFYFRFSSARVSHFFLCIAGTFQAYSKFFSNELEHLAWWNLCSNCYFPPAGSGPSGFDTMRKAHTFSMIYVLQRLKCPRWQMQCSGIHPSPADCSTFLPNSVHKGTFSFLPTASGEKNQSWSLHVTTCVIFLSIWPTRQCDRNSLPLPPRRRNTCTCVFQEQPPACDAAMQPVLLPDEFTCHNSLTLIKHLASLQYLLLSCLLLDNKPTNAAGSKETFHK